ncbi:RagB/SusD family nutrient uptake outer membrane protein [Chitinophaga ginsengisoli]|uniref:SusD-like starch-binding protein associating with outer membrane n=1 Tax=Chitinophaga ginsengisoli TaxID=363837 RepID=A0A2P8GCU6_9BACT|nr:RagB/SusD family nutrient uptake outer membrane protein [Chitinophaga ginsengisoli]PSL31802.1 SusD-like starch-binding protein associating with outer membrane [Chitinophaga ginsengisoli]
MTKKLLYTLIAIPVLVFSACSKDYLDTNPTDSYPSESVFTTVQNAWSAINGIHRALYIQYDAQDQGGQGSIMINNDMLGDDLVMTAAGNGWFNSNYQWLTHRNASATFLKFTYLFYYKIIANANMIIDNIDKAVGDDGDRKVIKGQAQAYRAWAYWNLVQMYGKRYDATTDNSQWGVPLVLTSTTEGLPRATVAQVYTQIVKDIDDAIVNLEGFNKKPKSHISINVAKGIKARIALTMQNWEVAATYAAEARAGVALMSNADYKTGFNDVGNKEWMWGSHQISEQTTYFYSFFAFMSANYNSSNIRTNPKAINSVLYGKITNTDIRKQVWSNDGQDVPVPTGGVRFPFINKKFLVATASSIGDVPLMRAAEMYLIEAEARAHLHQDAAAADALYTLAVNRDPQYTKSTATGDALLQEILTQRRVELWGEGFRFYDLKRLHLPLNRTGANHTIALTAGVMEVPIDDIRWEFLFPQDEINANKAIQQNPI